MFSQPLIECKWQKNIVHVLIYWGGHYLKFYLRGQGLKKNELAKFNLGKYSVNCFGGFSILEAKLYPMDEKYSFIVSGKSKGCVILDWSSAI